MIAREKVVNQVIREESGDDFPTEGKFAFVPYTLHSICVPIDEVMLWEKNPRLNDESALELAELIKVNGYRDPISVDQNNVVRAGNTRYKAAKIIGMQMIPVAKSRFKNEHRATAYALSNNKIAERSRWNNDILKELMKAEEIPSLKSEFGFKTAELDRLGLFGNKKNEAREFNKKSVVGDVKIGDMFLLGGKHRLLCGDSLKIRNIERLTDGIGEIEMLFTSPQYNAGSSGIYNFDSRYTHKDDEEEILFTEMIVKFIKMYIAKANYSFVNLQMLSANKIALIDMMYELKNNLVDLLIWDKINAAPAMLGNILNSRFEFIYCYASEERAQKRVIGSKQFRGTVDNVISLDKGCEKREFADYHKATFPVLLPEKFILNFTNRDQYVIDPMGGTGSTLIACAKTDRKCLIADIEPSYCALIIQRYLDETNEKIERLN